MGIIRKFIDDLHSFVSFQIDNYIFYYQSIGLFDDETRSKIRAQNDINNKARELLIVAMANNDIPAQYNKSRRWQKLHANIHEYLQNLSTFDFDHYSLKLAGGRLKNYDFECTYFDRTNYILQVIHIEFKFNASSILHLPQIIQLGNISQYFDINFEEYFYTHYLCNIIEEEQKNLTIDDYKKYVNNVSPIHPVLANIQQKYYSGCKQSSRFSGQQDDIEFYQKCQDLSKHAIMTYLTRARCYSSYLLQKIQNSQNKVYMLYHKGVLYGSFAPMMTNLLKVEILPEKYSIVLYFANFCINCLLRWKNGNGIAMPALQIRVSQTKTA